jgi:hypothetical protein
MNLQKKIRAMAAPIVGVVLVLGVPAWAQSSTQPSSETASTTAPKSNVTSKMSAVKHEPGSAVHTAKAPKSSTELTTPAK